MSQLPVLEVVAMFEYGLLADITVAVNATPGAYISLILAGSLAKDAFRVNHNLEISIASCVLSFLNDLTSIACAKQMIYQFQ